VTALDQSVSRNNATNLSTVVKYLNLADPPLAPEGGESGDPPAGPQSDGGVASALTAPATTSSETSVPRWLGLRLDEIDLNSGRVADAFQQLADWNSPTVRKLLIREDRMADALGLDHELLESLLADLGLD
jgi:hypothetical protein